MLRLKRIKNKLTIMIELIRRKKLTLIIEFYAIYLIEDRVQAYYVINISDMSVLYIFSNKKHSNVYCDTWRKYKHRWNKSICI